MQFITYKINKYILDNFITKKSPSENKNAIYNYKSN